MVQYIYIYELLYSVYKRTESEDAKRLLADIQQSKLDHIVICNQRKKLEFHFEMKLKKIHLH